MSEGVQAATRTVEVIAEIGENHVGDLARAEEMVRRAAAAGADVVKFQSYRGVDVADDDPEKDWFSQVELSDDAHRHLLEVALDYLNERCDTVYISTGLADLDEVRVAVSHLSDVEDVCIMHCVTQYPLADEDANLRAITAMAEAFPERRIGYSDHTIGTMAPILAVACGATAVEKHFTLDRSLPGTDHELSLLPEELEAMVADIRKVEVLLGSPEKRPVPAEVEIREFVRGRFPKE